MNMSDTRCFCYRQTRGNEQEDESLPTVVCANCKRYIHLKCANLLPHQANELHAFYCYECLPYTGPSIAKTITNSHRHNRVEINPETLPIQTGTPDFMNYLRKNSAIGEPRAGEIRKMRGQHLTLKELCLIGFDRPIQIETSDGLELQIDAKFTLDNLAQFYSLDHVLDCFEVTRQVAARLTLGYLQEQLRLGLNERLDVYLTRLDLSQNEQLSRSIHPPRIVRKLSWIEQYYPRVPFRPELLTYAFVTMENGYVDFHIDMGGASAWYHIINGEQTFIFVEPSDTNLQLFDKWYKSDKKQEEMFFVSTERHFRLRLNAGETLLIPNGWIYAILTTEDTLAVGGYFLHSISIAQQLRVHDFLLLNFAQHPHVQFPSYELTCWYAAPNLEKLIKDCFKSRIPKHLLEGVEALLHKLNHWLNRSRRKSDARQHLVPQAIDCAKIVRDLRRVLATALKATSKTKTPGKESQAATSMKILIHAPPTPKIDPEEAKIKDFIENVDANSEGEESGAGGSGLKLKLNMKLAQDVIRRSLEDPYELPAEPSHFHLLHDPKSKKAKKHKRKLEQIEIAKMVEGRPEDDHYIYLDLETPEENRAAIKKSGDEAWRPSTSAGAAGASKIKTTKVKVKTEMKTPVVGKIKTEGTAMTSSATTTESQDASAKAKLELKKFKKGMLTPKQRLAKKLKMR